MSWEQARVNLSVYGDTFLKITFSIKAYVDEKKL